MNLLWQELRQILLKPRIVLIADDDPDVGTLAKSAARGFCINLEVALTREEVSHRMLQQPPLEYIFLDVKFPRPDESIALAYEIFKGVRPCRLIVISAEPWFFKEIEKSFEMGFLSFMRKGGNLRECFIRAFTLLNIPRLPALEK